MVSEKEAGIFIIDKLSMIVLFLIITEINLGSFCSCKCKLRECRLQRLLTAD